jgi:hypothetical protein
MEGYDFVEHHRQPLAKPAFQAIRDALMHHRADDAGGDWPANQYCAAADPVSRMPL